MFVIIQGLLIGYLLNYFLIYYNMCTSSSCEDTLPLEVSQALMDVMSEQLQGLLHAVHQQEAQERDSTEHVQEETFKHESKYFDYKCTLFVEFVRLLLICIYYFLSFWGCRCRS